jgi:hypothetical protein
MVKEILNVMPIMSILLLHQEYYLKILMVDDSFESMTTFK